MKILWITNTLFPDICIELGISVPVIGGWMHSGAKALLNENSGIKLAVATLYKGKELKSIHLNGITYFLLPNKWNNRKYEYALESHWKTINSQFKPDIVHLHGSEYPGGLAFIKACSNKNVVVSLQGLVSVYEKYYYGGISRYTLLKNTTLRDFVRLDTIFLQQSNMHKRGLWEKETLQSVYHVIGRTLWDKNHTWALNPSANYHFCNETLRESFYAGNWEVGKCERYSIFLSQANYPIKGLHKMIEALPLIIRHFPSVKVYVAGNDFITNRRWKLSGYGKYISSQIDKYRLKDKIIFTGNLSEKNMCERYLNSHVFVCPSSIENSSNSVGEAQLLGVPCVASYVGGMSNLISQRKTGILYRFEEIEMLANGVCEIFYNDTLATELSKKAKEEAVFRHNGKINAQQLCSIYESILR